MAWLRADIGYRFIGPVVADSNILLVRNISWSIVRGLTGGRARLNIRIIGSDRLSSGISPSKEKVIMMAHSGESADRDNGSKSPYTLLVVAVALVDTKGRVLLAERPTEKHLEGLYEFPGGKVEAWESPEAALVRELEEELGICVKVEDLMPITFASHAYEDVDFHLLMPLYGECFVVGLDMLFFVCHASFCMYCWWCDDGTSTAITGLNYTACGGLIHISKLSAGCKWEGEEISLGAENQRLVWCHAEELDDFDMPPADFPLLPAIKRFISCCR